MSERLSGPHFFPYRRVFFDQQVAKEESAYPVAGPLTGTVAGRRNIQVRQRKLSADLAAKIFQERTSDPTSKYVESEVIAKFYGISSKTVRDVWDRKSWARHTKNLVHTFKELPQAQRQKSEPNQPSPSQTDKTHENPQDSCMRFLVSEKCEQGEGGGESACSSAPYVESCLSRSNVRRSSSSCDESDASFGPTRWSREESTCECLDQSSQEGPNEMEEIAVGSMEFCMPEDTSEWCLQPREAQRGLG
ncbi:hypothetical protein GUITHDRAFT_117046 [Guillardia theta CCMP2712]|uniref:Uncharacterized protein n=1 Tax=Guillardia theta (strain CCMP2712) TaxID=905079 RepID=L1IKH3_GUITC|nr:hypothetical protein GUITHDRAFT_117046 [Guillardia theta CCMP2712]EKX36748.1 hypothetical protein GUITHDRAFT_117046 [Guillardia theta CCMP2712]|mmetsp:Transcript_52093/g.161948  ORF Transcript_52093/g.161948 Transcript_52093/m.161948 type:complete len:248 (-) Transcript_52093:225-968(-)|eukprot:XP_005823728.1 hypothetical protein GUITHDRAFT_117046 [Guillardia theta CCMP2712]